MKNINNIEIKISNNLVDYKESLKIMEKRVVDINLNNKKELIWFLYHDHIYTIGTSGSEKEIREKITYPVIKTNRGGQFTYHGPGQRIAYIMLNVRDREYNVKSFIRLLEQWIMNSLHDMGIKSFLIKGKVGIWVRNEEKIASLGLRIRKGISFHGVSLNINPNLDHFSGIIPCGNENSDVTSIEKIGLDISKKEIDNILISNFSKVFKIDVKLTQTLS